MHFFFLKFLEDISTFCGATENCYAFLNMPQEMDTPYNSVNIVFLN